MRIVYGRSAKAATQAGGQLLQSRVSQDEAIEKQGAKSVRPVARINGQRIHFAELASMAFPQKTDANLAFLASVDMRTARRWLADDTEPPADVLGIILAEIMRRFHQRA